MHLTNYDVNLAIREHYNIGMEKKEQEISCPVCGQENPHGAIECRNCRRPLSLKSVAEVDRLRKAIDVIAKLEEEGKLAPLLRLSESMGASGCEERNSVLGTSA